MSKKVKFSEPMLNPEDLERTLKELNEFELELGSLLARKTQELMAIEDQYHSQSFELATLIGKRRNALHVYLNAHAKDFEGPPRSFEFKNGTIGFRLGQKQLKPLSKWTWEKIKDALSRAGAARFIRTKIEADKEALLGAVLKDKLSVDTLKTFGIKIVQEDRPFVETNYDKNMAF